MKAAHAEGDPQALLDLAHRIKGGARMVNARRLILGCERLEQACSEPVDPVVLEQAVQDLQDAMQRLDRHLGTRSADR